VRVYWRSRCVFGRLSSHLEIEKANDCYVFNHKSRVHQSYLYYQKRSIDRLDLSKRRYSPAYTDRGPYGLLERTPGNYEPLKHRTHIAYRYAIQIDHTKSPARVCYCQFRGYRTYEGRRPDKAVAADEVYGVCEAIGTSYVASGTVKRRPSEGSYLRGHTEMEIYA